MLSDNKTHYKNDKYPEADTLIVCIRYQLIKNYNKVNIRFKINKNKQKNTLIGQ